MNKKIYLKIKIKKKYKYKNKILNEDDINIINENSINLKNINLKNLFVKQNNTSRINKSQYTPTINKSQYTSIINKYQYTPRINKSHNTPTINKSHNTPRINILQNLKNERVSSINSDKNKKTTPNFTSVTFIKRVSSLKNYKDIQNSNFNIKPNNIPIDFSEYFQNSNLNEIVEPFFDEDIIIEKSDNIIFDINKPSFEKIVLKSDRLFEGEGTGYFTILYVNNEYRFYYRGLPYKNAKNYSTEALQPFENICLAISSDGLNFNNKQSLFKNDLCHNFSPIYLENNNKFLAISGTKVYNHGLWLISSENGIIWNLIKILLTEKNLIPNWTHGNHFDSLNCIVYNNKEQAFYIYFRHNDRSRRQVQYTTTKDFNNFTPTKLLPLLNDKQVYAPGIFKYFNSNYIISIPTIANPNNTEQKNCNNLFISNDFINFKKLDNNLFDDRHKMNVNGIVPSKDKTKMYIYTHINPTEIDNHIECYSYPMHRIHKIICKEDGFIKIKPINLSNKNISVNFETFENGSIIVEIYDKDNNLILKSNKNIGNELNYIIKWDLDNEIIIDDYYIKFILNNVNLYSFTYNL